MHINLYYRLYMFKGSTEVKNTDNLPEYLHNHEK